MKIWVRDDNGKTFDPWQAADILGDIARSTDVALYGPHIEGRALSLRIVPRAGTRGADGLKRWQRTSIGSWSYSERLGRNRAVHAICWHGHYAFMSELFARFPKSKVRSGNTNARLGIFATVYDGADMFDRLAANTGSRSVGSMYEPMAYEDACECHACGDDDPARYDRLTYANPAKVALHRAVARGVSEHGAIVEQTEDACANCGHPVSAHNTYDGCTRRVGPDALVRRRCNCTRTRSTFDEQLDSFADRQASNGYAR